MNALIKSEYDKLSPFRKTKFDELVGWQSTTHKGGAIALDQGAYFKILDWVSKLPETNPEPPIEKPTEE
jgi:hypothetical protein